MSSEFDIYNMENRDRSCPTVVCEKIRRAVSKYPSFRLARRISSRNQEPNHATSATEPSKLLAPSVRTIDIQSNGETSKRPKPAMSPRFPKLQDTAEMVPVSYASSNKLRPAETPKKTHSKNTPAVAEAASKIEPEPAPRFVNPGQTKVQTIKAGDAGGKKARVNNEDHFLDYITRFRDKIGRSISNMSDGRSTSATAGDQSTSQNQKDKFTEYIDRAKMKMRRMSTVGPGK